MAKETMMRFVTVERDMPDKRPPDLRRKDFQEIYGEYAREKPPSRPGAAASAACRIARRIARCTTTSPTGCA
jgi:hypothetical protein